MIWGGIWSYSGRTLIGREKPKEGRIPSSKGAWPDMGQRSEHEGGMGEATGSRRRSMARLTVSWWPREVIAGNRSKPQRRRGLHWGEEEADGSLSDEVMEV